MASRTVTIHGAQAGDSVTMVGPAGLAFHLAEAWLSARQGSWFPTNGAGPDEDVNVYVAHLLREFSRPGPARRREADGCALSRPPTRNLPRGSRIERYRRQGDRLLLHFGLFRSGDGRRRRAVPWGLTEDEARARDLADMRSCYACAAALLERGGPGGLRAVMEKLAGNGEDYVHVLQVLATRHFGLGARLKNEDLDSLMADPDAGRRDETVADLIRPQADSATVDVVLDLVLEHRRRPTPELSRRIANLARPLGLDGDRLLAAAR